MAERGRGDSICEFFVDDLEGFGEIGFAGDKAGNVVAGDKVVEFGKQRFDAGIELVEVGNNGYFCDPCPLGGLKCRGSVVAIDEERAGMRDPVALKFGGLDREAIVMASEDGAFARGVDGVECQDSPRRRRSARRRAAAFVLTRVGGAKDQARDGRNLGPPTSAADRRRWPDPCKGWPSATASGGFGLDKRLASDILRRQGFDGQERASSGPPTRLPGPDTTQIFLLTKKTSYKVG